VRKTPVVTSYEQLVREAAEQPDILGLILVGSRGKGFENEHSDHDVVMVAKGDAVSALKRKYADLDNVDLSIHSLADFKIYAGWGSSEEWDRYNYARATILVDKTGQLEALVQEKGSIPRDKLDKFIEGWLDGYINGVYRSVKCTRDGNMFGAHLEAANSVLDLLTVVFALNGRHRPFLGYIAKELEKYPLERLPWPASDFVAMISRVLADADLHTQQELLIGVEKMARSMGHGHIFDGWKGKDRWAMAFRP
jgi:hypothetical protein